jgi:hypothetical protein
VLIPVHRLMSGGLEGEARTCVGLFNRRSSVMSRIEVAMGAQVAPQRASDLEGG